MIIALQDNQIVLDETSLQTIISSYGLSRLKYLSRMGNPEPDIYACLAAVKKIDELRQQIQKLQKTTDNDAIRSISQNIASAMKIYAVDYLPHITLYATNPVMNSFPKKFFPLLEKHLTNTRQGMISKCDRRANFDYYLALSLKGNDIIFRQGGLALTGEKYLSLDASPAEDFGHFIYIRSQTPKLEYLRLKLKIDADFLAMIRGIKIVGLIEAQNLTSIMPNIDKPMVRNTLPAPNIMSQKQLWHQKHDFYVDYIFGIMLAIDTTGDLVQPHMLRAFRNFAYQMSV